MSTRPEKFVWPPLGEVAPPGPAQRRTAPAPSPSTWSLVERAFLGVVRPTWAERVAEEAWSPDEPGEACERCGRSNEHSPPGETGDDTGCAYCRQEQLGWDRVVRLGGYEGLLRGSILEAKESAWRNLARDMGKALGEQLVRACHPAGVDPRVLNVVPVPTSWRRRLSRGIDHTLAIARGVCDTSGARLLTMLTRRHRPHQTGTTLGTRRRNVANTMRVRLDAPHPATLAGGTIVLVDDVMTSGATMLEASRAIRVWAGMRSSESGQPDAPAIWIAVLARVTMDAQPAP